jgi:hypothetical protein
MAVISIEDDGDWGYFGSGSLISQKHVLAHAAAVSYTDDSKNSIPVSNDRAVIYLGTTKYGNLSEPGSMKVGVHSIVNHPLARKVLPTLRINQISVVTLDRDVAFTEFIRPVCLWPLKTSIEQFNGKDAYAVGYGRDHTGEDSLVRKHVRVTIEQTCKNNYAKELQFNNETRHFCVDANDEGRPCANDDQLFIKIGSNWFIKGTLVTIVTEDNGNGSCSKGNQALYEDIEPYYAMIKLFMAN